MGYLRSLDHAYSVVSVDDRVHLVHRASAVAATHYGPVVVVETSLTSFEGRGYGSADLADGRDDAHSKIAADIAAGNAPKVNPPDPAMLYIAVDGAVSWDRVVAVADDARAAGFTHAKLVFARPAGAGPPPRTWVEDKFDALRTSANGDGGQLATGVAGFARDIIKGCSALEKVYGAVGAEEGGDKATELFEGTGPALVDCNCAADMPALRSVMWVMLGDPHPTGVVSVELSTSGKMIALPAKTAWKDAAAQVVDGAVVTLVAQ